MSNDRLLIPDIVPLRRDDLCPSSVELWDARTGGLVARLDALAVGFEGFTFFGDGRWVVGHDRTASGRSTLHVYSAATGRLLARLPRVGLRRLLLSPSGRVMATSSEDDTAIQFWDTTTWQPVGTWARVGFPLRMNADDCITSTADDPSGSSFVYRVGTDTPIAKLPGGLWQHRLDDRVLLENGQVYDARTWHRLQPSPGRQFHAAVSRFAPDGRFVLVEKDLWMENNQLLDTATEKSLTLRDTAQCYGYRPGAGWISVSGSGDPRREMVYRLPTPDRLTIPPDLLELWAQVVVRGHLTDDGVFVPWDEPTWDRKRGELAARPAPWPDFPFPGRVAADRLHWLRGEFAFGANEAKQLPFARELLRRAEAAGDRDEAVYWRRVVELRAVPAVAPPPREVKP